ncbi:hypothetical protein R3P38DRAFT_2750386, partial [Favolaschia claudopus]
MTVPAAVVDSPFGSFPTHARSSPSNSSTVGRIWQEWTPRLISRFSPSRQSMPNHEIFDDNASILAARSPFPPQMLTNDSVSELSFQLYPHSVDSASLKSADSASIKFPTPQPPLPTDAELAERARAREVAAKSADGHLRQAPSVADADSALKDIGTVLRPPRKKGPGYIDPKLDPFTRSRIEGIRSFLALYASPQSPTYGKWKAASIAAALTMGRSTYCARVLRRLAREYISDRSLLPENLYGYWN